MPHLILSSSRKAGDCPHDRRTAELGEPTPGEPNGGIGDHGQERGDAANRPAGRSPVEEPAGEREIGAGDDQKRPDGANRNDGKKLPGAFCETERDDQQDPAENHRGQAGACTKPVLRLKPTRAVAHRHRTERCQREIATPEERARRRSLARAASAGNISRQRLAVTITALVSVSGSCGMTASSMLRHTSPQLGMTSFGRLDAKRSPSGKITSAALHPTSVAMTSMSGAAGQRGMRMSIKKERERT